jgi:pyrroline-5-carboxylate reductase
MTAPADTARLDQQTVLGVVGFGQLGGAMVDGLLSTRRLRPDAILVLEPAPARRSDAARLGCRLAATPSDLTAAGLLLVAVKPQTWPEVAPDLARLAPRPAVLSIMAGLGRARIAEDLAGGPDAAPPRVARAMPNIPARMRLAITAIAGLEALRPDEAELARLILGSIGEIAEVPEPLFHAVTALSGSGPAYVFRLAECMEQAARDLGVPPAVARLLVSRTIRGAGAMLSTEGSTPQTLRDMVTSRAGTTAAALEVLERWGIEPTVVDAIRAAERRSRELAGEPTADG